MIRAREAGDRNTRPRYTMDIQNRFVGFCATTVDDEREILVKPDDLAATLLLFDDYIFESCKLLEFPQLVSIFVEPNVMF